ncbi:MAG: FAD-dependent oxidoreductase [Pseudomonas sp.]|nr:FAD-dependent oxidoreductase [Pseudomonas sp.]
MTRSDVLIIGAGPTGLVLALWLSHAGVKVRIIDKTDAPGTTSRALAVQARTLELYRQLDLTDAVIGAGHKMPGVNLWVRGEQAAHLSLTDIGQSRTPYSFLEIYPQDQHEQLLIERLARFGVEVERHTELTDFIDDQAMITAYLKTPDGQVQTCQARYLAGCDGARSTVRKALTTGFPGGTYSQLFYVADVQALGPAVNGELHVDLDEADFLAVFPLAGEGRARLIGTVRGERAVDADALAFADVSQRAIDQLKLEVLKVNWFSTYHVHHRVAEHFRAGNVFVLGDAAHVHSPAGGQGMNTGIGDAINLAWKLAAVLAGRATPALLDSYEAERIGFARQLVATTDRVFSFATADGWLANRVRTRLAPRVLPRIMALKAVRDFMFRTVSQIGVNYRNLPLSEGVAGHVHGGDRLPWAKVAGRDNFDSLHGGTWQIHVYGRASEALLEWGATHNVPVHIFSWHTVHEHAGFSRDAFYLMRPDTYVALAQPYGDPTVLDEYFRRRGITP